MDTVLKEDREKIERFKKLGYDIPRARDLVLAKAGLSGKVLEIGTGRGHLAMALARKKLHVVSIDKDKNQQKIARANLKAKGFEKYIALRRGDAECLPFGECSFGAVISVNFLHHARRPLVCVREMVRVAAEKLVLADLNKKGEEVMERMHRSEGQGHPRSGISFPALRKFLERSGMSVKTYRRGCETILLATKRRDR